MDLEEVVRQDLKRMEGTVLHAYPDHLGFWTLGTGRLIDKRKGGGITSEEADYLLDNDIGRIRSGLMKALPWFNRAPAGIRRALMNMAFQMGLQGVLGFKNTLALIQDGRYQEAADNALKSQWARQTPARAKEVTEWIRGAGR